MKLLTVGDSFTYGDEMDNPLTHAWPVVLGKMINYEVTNLGKNASSNDRIFRHAVSETIKNDYDLVIIGWSEVSRLDVREDLQVTVNSFWLKQLNPWIVSWIKDYYANAYDEEHAVETWLTRVITLQEFFKSKKQKYLFVNMAGFNNELGPTHLTSQIDTKFYYGWNDQTGMTHWMGDCPLKNKHPLELGHQRIAEEINNYLTSINYV